MRKHKKRKGFGGMLLVASALLAAVELISISTVCDMMYKQEIAGSALNAVLNVEGVNRYLDMPDGGTLQSSTDAQLYDEWMSEYFNQNISVNGPVQYHREGNVIICTGPTVTFTVNIMGIDFRYDMEPNVQKLYLKQ